MTIMCKFKVEDRVRVIDPRDPFYDKVGTIIDHERDFYLAYEVRFTEHIANYYAANHLILAPGEHE